MDRNSDFFFLRRNRRWVLGKYLIWHIRTSKLIGDFIFSKLICLRLIGPSYFFFSTRFSIGLERWGREEKINLIVWVVRRWGLVFRCQFFFPHVGISFQYEAFTNVSEGSNVIKISPRRFIRRRKIFFAVIFPANWRKILLRFDTWIVYMSRTRVSCHSCDSYFIEIENLFDG